MDRNFLENRQSYESRMSNRISKGISNATDVLKSEDEDNFEASIKKGEVEVLTKEDINESYNGQFWKGEDIAVVEKNIDALIAKGESNYLEESEWNDLEKAMEDVKSLEQKAVAVNGGQSYKRIFVQKAEEEAPAE